MFVCMNSVCCAKVDEVGDRIQLTAFCISPIYSTVDRSSQLFWLFSGWLAEIRIRQFQTVTLCMEWISEII